MAHIEIAEYLQSVESLVQSVTSCCACIRQWIELTHTPTAKKSWCLYLIECRSGSYYAGITNDLEARYRAHLEGRGARYTRANPPLCVIGSRPFPDRASASRAEAAIKRLPRAKKIAFLIDIAVAD